MKGQGADQELAADHDSDVTSVASSGANNSDSDYVELYKNSPASSDNSPELETIIEKIVQMHNDVNTAIRYFSTPRAIFTYPHKLDLLEIIGKNTILNETPRDNGIMPPLLTQPFLPQSPPVDNPEVPASPSPRTSADASAAACLSSECALEGIFPHIRRRHALWRLSVLSAPKSRHTPG